LPVAAAGYFVYGEAVDPNIVLTVKNTTLTMLANMLLAMHLILAFLIIINPVCQELEEIFQVPHGKYEKLGLYKETKHI
jgi:vesicular inhibitory amino acid transporter